MTEGFSLLVEPNQGKREMKSFVIRPRVAYSTDATVTTMRLGMQDGPTFYYRSRIVRCGGAR